MLLAKQQVRFLIAGCFNTALDFLLLNVLTLAFEFPPLLANSFSVMLGIGVSYALNHFFVFRYPYRISVVKFLQFFAVTGFSSLVLQNLIITLFENFFDTRFGNSLLVLPDPAGQHFLALNIAKLFAVLVGLVWNFTLYRFVIFRNRGGDAALEIPIDTQLPGPDAPVETPAPEALAPKSPLA